MRSNSQAIAKEVQDQMVQTRGHVAARLHAIFKSRPVVEAIGAERAGLLAEHTAQGGSTLLWVSAQMREAIVERRPENRLRPLALWHVIDAIGHLADCQPGRWPYFNDQKRLQSLQWAGQELDELEQAVAECVGVAETTERAAELTPV